MIRKLKIIVPTVFSVALVFGAMVVYAAATIESVGGGTWKHDVWRNWGPPEWAQQKYVLSHYHHPDNKHSASVGYIADNHRDVVVQRSCVVAGTWAEAQRPIPHRTARAWWNNEANC